MQKKSLIPYCTNLQNNYFLSQKWYRLQRSNVGFQNNDLLLLLLLSDIIITTWRLARSVFCNLFALLIS